MFLHRLQLWAKEWQTGGGIERVLDALAFFVRLILIEDLKGAVGLDSIRLHFWETVEKAKLDKKVMQHLGATANWNNVGQVYPRSLDFEVVSLLVRLIICSIKFRKNTENYGRARASW